MIEFWKNRKRKFWDKGLGAQIAAVILILIFFGLMLPIYYVVSDGFLTWQQTYYPIGFFPGLMGDVLTFLTNYWYWWPILGILFPMIIWSILQAMRRRQQDAL